MSDIIYRQTKFLLSAAELEQLPPDKGSEVAFIGRSNSGKSSAINAITGIKKLARTSKTPGRTQTINLFTINNHARLVDLPGYGYTKAPISVSKRWMGKVNEYLKTRHCLKCLIILMDVRHPLKEQDQHLLEWTMQCELPAHILLTKADKLSRNKATRTFKEVQQTLSPYQNLVTVQLFSSHSGQGLEELYQQLDKYLTS